MTSTPTREVNKRTVRRFMDEVSGKGNIGLIDELVAEDMVDHTEFGETQGREALKQTFEGLSAAFPTHENTIEEIVAEGDTVAIRVSSRLTHEGNFMGIEATGQQVQTEGIVFFRLRDGKIVERWVQFDTLGMMQQLGVAEQPVG
ncbi:ester cyclase [Haloferax sp. S1W]|uniref:ester cyclase n=1 Tax=Haloferax sp. S1W TaxID=3377110 RepID=UPI0037CA7190